MKFADQHGRWNAGFMVVSPDGLVWILDVPKWNGVALKWVYALVGQHKMKVKLRDQFSWSFTQKSYSYRHSIA